MDDVIKEFVNGQTPSRNHDEYWKGNIPWLSSGELNYGFINDSIEKITEKGQKSANLRILPRNTFLIAIFGLEATGTRGSCGILNIPSTISQACMALIPYEEKLKMNFLYYWYNKVGDLYGVKYTQGTKQQNFNIELLKKLSITLPSNLEEQEKIANFLSLIDKKIEFLEKTLVLYQRNKQYFLNLFFNDNSEYSFSSNTKKVKLGSILSLQGGFNFDSKKFNVNAKNKVIKIGDIPNNLNLDKFNGDYSEQDCDEKYIVSNGDIVIALSGATFGKSGLIFGTEQAFINQRVAKFKCENCDYHYIYQLINSQKFKKYLNKIPTSSAQPNISNKDILRYREFIPDLAEQKKIGYFLSLFDRKINFILKSKNNLIEFRRGLLQKMFI